MRPPLCMLVLLLALTCTAQPLLAQLPFYTDNPQSPIGARFTSNSSMNLTVSKSSQYPNLHQNWANFKFNYGLPRELELDLDYPYLSIYRAPGQQSSSGIGEHVDFGD